MARIKGTSGDDVLVGTAQIDQLFGFAGDDELNGRASIDSLTGGAGNDRLSGGRGADRLRGGEGDDMLLGGGDADKLIGGLGKDRLVGGEGADSFQFLSLAESTTGQPDVIVDFSQEEKDVIDLRLIDANLSVAGDQAFTFIEKKQFSGAEGELRFEKQGQTLLVEADGDGDAVADFAITVLGNFDFDVNGADRDFIL